MTPSLILFAQSFLPDLEFYVGDRPSSFSFEDFVVKRISHYTISYVTSQVNPSSPDDTSKDMDLPEDITHDSGTREFLVYPEREQSFSVRVTGNLFSQTGE